MAFLAELLLTIFLRFRGLAMEQGLGLKKSEPKAGISLSRQHNEVLGLSRVFLGTMKALAAT
jgi:hypothetical protein